jgi:hypothetical protein
MSKYVIQSRNAKRAFYIATAKHHLRPVFLPCLLQPDHGCLASHTVTLLMSSQRIAASALLYNSEQNCGFRSVIDEDYGSLKYDAVVNVNLSLMFWRSLMLLSAG